MENLGISRQVGQCLGVLLRILVGTEGGAGAAELAHGRFNGLRTGGCLKSGDIGRLAPRDETAAKA